MADEEIDIVWRPGRERLNDCNMRTYTRWLADRHGLDFDDDYEALWQWSVDNVEGFWATMWEYFDVPHSQPYSNVLDTHVMPGAHWFEGAKLNLVEQIFRFNHGADADKTAIYSRSELRELQTLSWGELRRQITSLAAALRGMGVVPGDRVVAYLPNIEETIVAFCATASIGAIWSSCSPDMGTNSVLDRFSQIDPKVLITVDGYRYGGKDFDRLDVVCQLREGLPTLQYTILLPYLDTDAALENSHDFASLCADDVDIDFEQVDFEHPLWVLYSSGTTGMPKSIVHGQGGILLELLKHASLHIDLGPDDRYMWMTTTGWMMWNTLISALLVGSSLCLYDGSPGYPDMGALWRFAAESGVTFFGAGAAYYDSCKKAGIEPAELADLSALRSIGSTGSPLSPESYHWINEHVGSDVMIAAISGGTDVCTAFVGGCPVKPVVAGEMPSRGLGAAVYAMDEAGNKLDDEVGELVITEPLPTMPLIFWGDEDGSRLRASYFEDYPGYWRHGDWIRITPRGGAVIYGRSDATINRHGIRMGTSEIYRVVESIDAIVDSLVVDLEHLGKESWMPLFVVLRAGEQLTDELKKHINVTIRARLSPRYTPDEIIAVAQVPRTLSGKKMELPIKKLLHGQPLEQAASADAMSNPESLDYYMELARQWTSGATGRA